MDAGFNPCLRKVSDAYQKLLDAAPVAVDNIPSQISTTPGVYVFYEDGKPLRVGTSRKLGKRIKQHYSNNARSAAFAKLLARCETGIKGGTRPGEGWKTQVKENPRLEEEFRRARKRIPKMSVRWVEEPDAACRYLLEFYAAKELQTPYNDFSET